MVGLDPQTPWHERPIHRQDRILDEAHACSGDVRLICDLFGLFIAGAYRYVATVDRPGIAYYERAPH